MEPTPLSNKERATLMLQKLKEQLTSARTASILPGADKVLTPSVLFMMSFESVRRIDVLIMMELALQIVDDLPEDLAEMHYGRIVDTVLAIFTKMDEPPPPGGIDAWLSSRGRKDPNFPA